MKRYKSRKPKKTVERRKRTDKVIRKITVKNKIDDFKKDASKKAKTSNVDIVFSNSIGVASENIEATNFDKLSNDKITEYDIKLKASTRTP
tara:strand:- start:247 stop:519 length:273 start_codon:yes stop_codon:yes gene_type:complete